MGTQDFPLSFLSFIIKKNYISYQKYVEEAIINGTLLPKGHGRIVDENEIIEYLKNIQFELDKWGQTDSAIEIAKARIGLDIVSTIIEKDKGETNEYKN